MSQQLPPQLRQIPPEDWQRTPETVRQVVESLFAALPSTEKVDPLVDGPDATSIRGEQRYRQVIQAQTDLILIAPRYHHHLCQRSPLPGSKPTPRAGHWATMEPLCITGRSKEQVLREKALNRVFQSIGNSLDLETIFATAITETARPLNLKCVVQYIPEYAVWRHVAEYHRLPNTPSMVGFEIPDQGNPFAEQLKQLQRVCVEDTSRLGVAINQVAPH